MNQFAVVVDDISKQFRIGDRYNSHRTLRESVTSSLKKPYHKIKSMMKGQTENTHNAHQMIWALKDVSFTVNYGEAVGIVGNNGAGKSTLLKLLSRITEPTKGTAKIYGRLGSLLEVGTGFHPELTGRENIFLNGAILGMKKHEITTKFDEIVAFAEIEKFLDTPVKHYSSGMYIRLAFSVAAHLEPEILVIDEVLAVGDIRFQKKCLGKMGDVAKSGRTVIFVSHNMPAVRTLCNKGIYLDQGMVQRVGPIDEVLHDYLSANSSQQIGKKIWEKQDRPGNSNIRMISMEVLDDQGQNVDSILISKNSCIKLTYEILETGSQAGFSLSILSEEGDCVFSSLSNQEKSFYGTPLQKGQYSTTCQIYGNLLNNGRYYVKLVGLSSSWSEPFTLDRVISFDAIDDGVLKGDYHGGYGGHIRPALKWMTERTLTNP